MLKCAVLFVVVLTADLGSSEIPETGPQPFATLYDQAMEKLNQLNERVTNEISEAQITFKDLRSNFDEHIDQKQTDGETAINTEAVKVDDELAEIKRTAESSGINIHVCLRGHEAYLEHLPSAISGELHRCHNELLLRVHEQLFNSINSIQYRTSNTLDKLYLQLTSCTTGSVICVTPVASEIEEASVMLPQIIEGQVEVAINHVGGVANSADECLERPVVMYIASADAIIEDIQACVNKLIS